MILIPDNKFIRHRFRDVIIVFIVSSIIPIGIAINFDSSKVALPLVVFCVMLLPTTYLFLEYFFRTKKFKSVEFSDKELVVNYKTGEKYICNYSDIKKIELYKPIPEVVNWYVRSKYYFAEIYYKNGKQIVLTNFLGPDLNEAIHSIKDVPLVWTKTNNAFLIYYAD